MHKTCRPAVKFAGVWVKRGAMRVEWASMASRMPHSFKPSLNWSSSGLIRQSMCTLKVVCSPSLSAIVREENGFLNPVSHTANWGVLSSKMALRDSSDSAALS